MVGRALAFAVLLLAVGCSDGHEPEPDGIDVICNERGRGMDTAALGVPEGPPIDVATAFMTEVLGWADGEAVTGDAACDVTVTRGPAGPSIAVMTSGLGDDARFASASSFADDQEAPLSASFIGTEASILTPATCPGCTDATVHFVYRGGVESVDVPLPVDARATLPAGATDRGVIVLFEDDADVVQAVLATSIPDGDFAAG